MGRSTEIGMCTFDQALQSMYEDGRISLDEALRNADSRTDLSLRIRLTSGVSPDESGELSIESETPDSATSGVFR